MLDSIIDDIKSQFRYGNKIVQIILINFFIFLGIIIVRAFSPASSGFFKEFLTWIALPSGFLSATQKPWTVVTHMFVHQGLWHIGWNMLMLYWFGKIVGDLIGDKKIVPLYIAGGLFGAVLFLFCAPLLSASGIAYGASAAVMAFVVAAGFLAPDYNMRLILLGDIKLKWIASALVLIDLVMLSEANNPGGRIAHLGGAVFGGLYIYMLQQGTDLLAILSNPSTKASRKQKRKTKMKVVHNVQNEKSSKQKSTRSEDLQSEVDRILDKINASGYDSLSAEDKEVLFRASKNQE